VVSRKKGKYQTSRSRRKEITRGCKRIHEEAAEKRERERERERERVGIQKRCRAKESETKGAPVSGRPLAIPRRDSRGSQKRERERERTRRMKRE